MTWKYVAIATNEGPATTRQYCSGDWALRRWGQEEWTTITHVPTGCTIGCWYQHHDSEWDGLLARLNACGPAPEPASENNPAYMEWMQLVKAATSRRVTQP